MTGAISLLRVRGNQDKLLVGETSFERNTYKTYKQSATETLKMEFKQNVDFGKKIQCVIPNRSEYVGKINLFLELPALTPIDGTYAGWTNSIGHAILQSIDLYIGEILIDRHSGLFLEILEELNGENKNENISIGKYSILESLKFNAVTTSKYVIPLKFWFCNDPANAFPSYALKYHNIRIDINLAKFRDLVTYDGTVQPDTKPIVDCYLLVDYIFSEDAVFNRASVKPQRILITQTQILDRAGETTNLGGSVFKCNVDFNHPVKELLWVFIETDSLDNNDYFNFSKRNTTPFTKLLPLMKNASIIIQGSEYRKSTDSEIYRIDNVHKNTTDKHIFTTAFCDNPVSFQPNGTLNFSAIDSFYIQGDMTTPTPENYLYVFGVNYNWLELRDGMCSLAFVT